MLVGETKINRALIVKEPWVSKILDNGKCWEMRSSSTGITGWIGLIKAGSGLIVGKTFVTSGHMTPDTEELKANQIKHQVGDFSLFQKWPFAWTLEGSERFENPIPYSHPHGAVTWVKL